MDEIEMKQWIVRASETMGVLLKEVDRMKIRMNDLEGKAACSSRRVFKSGIDNGEGRSCMRIKYKE